MWKNYNYKWKKTVRPDLWKKFEPKQPTINLLKIAAMMTGMIAGMYVYDKAKKGKILEILFKEKEKGLGNYDQEQ